MLFSSTIKNLPQSQLALTLEKLLPQPARKDHLPTARGVSETMSNKTTRMLIVVSIEGRWLYSQANSTYCLLGK